MCKGAPMDDPKDLKIKNVHGCIISFVKIGTPPIGRFPLKGVKFS